jgi:hypothetical protein
LAGDIHFEALGNIPAPLAPDSCGERSLHVHIVSWKGAVLACSARRNRGLTQNGLSDGNWGTLQLHSRRCLGRHLPTASCDGLPNMGFHRRPSETALGRDMIRTNHPPAPTPPR